MPFRARGASSSSRSARRSPRRTRRGIIHRDLKPENLMSIRRRDGTEHAKVLDFGLAKLRERDESAAITAGGQVRRHAVLHVARAGPRRGARPARRRLQPGRDALPRAHAALPPFQAPSPIGVLAKHLTDEVVPPRHARARAGAAARGRRASCLRAMAKAARGSLRVGGRGPGRPRAALASRPATRRARRRGVARAAARRLDGARRRRISIADAESRSAGSGGRRPAPPGPRRASSARCERRKLRLRLGVPLGIAALVAGRRRRSTLDVAAPRPVTTRARAQQHRRLRQPASRRTSPCRGASARRSRAGTRTSTTSGFPPARARASSARGCDGDPRHRSGARALRRSGAAPRQGRRPRPRLGRVAAADVDWAGRGLSAGAPGLDRGDSRPTRTSPIATR